MLRIITNQTIKTMLKLSTLISIIIFITLGAYAQQADEIIGKYHLPNGLMEKCMALKKGWFKI